MSGNNPSPELPDISDKDKAQAQIAVEYANNLASSDFAGWRELDKLSAFDKVFMRRIREKRAILEKSVINGVSDALYPIYVAKIALLKEIEDLPKADKMACVSHLEAAKSASKLS